MLEKINSEEEHIITIRDDALYGYNNIIDKIMHRKKPHVNILIRRKAFEPGIYRIRNGQTKRLTNDEIKIISNKRILWILLTNEEAKQILGIDNDENILKDYGAYVRALRKYFGRHEMAYQNHPYMFWHDIKPISKPVQQKLV
jgi:hypothetical protein